MKHPGPMFIPEKCEALLSPIPRNPAPEPGRKPMMATILPFEHRASSVLLPAVVDVPKLDAGIAWLIEHYDPPAELLHSSSAESDTTLEAVASVYCLRARSETFIEWLWRHYPPRAKDPGDPA